MCTIKGSFAYAGPFRDHDGLSSLFEIRPGGLLQSLVESKYADTCNSKRFTLRETMRTALFLWLTLSQLRYS